MGVIAKCPLPPLAINIAPDAFQIAADESLIIVLNFASNMAELLRSITSINFVSWRWWPYQGVNVHHTIKFYAIVFEVDVIVLPCCFETVIKTVIARKWSQGNMKPSKVNILTLRQCLLVKTMQEHQGQIKHAAYISVKSHLLDWLSASGRMIFN